jgi:hypothetical protein
MVRHCNSCDYDQSKPIDKRIYPECKTLVVEFPEYEKTEDLMQVFYKQWAEQMAMEIDREIIDSLIKQNEED